MYRPDDKDIDRLSREAAEHYHAPGEPSWETLRQTLEKEIPQEKEKKRRGFLFFFLLFAGLSLAGSGIWYGIHTSNSKTDIPLIAKDNTNQTKQFPDAVRVPPNTTSKDIVTKPAELPAGNLAAKSPNDVSKTIRDADKAVTVTIPGRLRSDAGSTVANGSSLKGSNGKQVGQRPQVSNEANGDQLRANKPRLSFKPTVKDNADVQKTAYGSALTTHSNRISRNRESLNKTKQKTIADNEPLISVATAADNNVDRPGTTAAAGSTLPVAGAQDSAGNKQEHVKDFTVKKEDSVRQNQDSVKTATVRSKNKSKSDKAILFGLTAGFDFSTVKFTYGSNAGYNFGLMGGYQFNKHWAVITGVTYTKKNYKLNGSDYHPPKHDWTQYVNLQKVDGFCRMWEIPVSARYTFNPGAKNVFFASTGLSSYFMKKQQYDYYYKNNMGMTVVAPWQNDSTFNHIFSILDLSVGLQKTAGKHLDLLIEPYAKIPLGGVGFGNIRLSSFGVNLTVQYKKPLKR